MASQKLNYLDASVMPQRHIGIRRFSQIGIHALMSPTVTVSGTFLTTPTEGEVVSGTQTITFTIARAIWPATISDTMKSALIAGIISRQSEATGWNALVKAVAAASTVARTSDTVLTFTIPATAGYHITADEILDVKLPRAIMVGGVKMQLIPAIATISNDAPTVSAALTGTFLTTPTEGEVVSGSQTIIITLTGGSWVASGATFNAQRQPIINGLVSDGAEAAGWNVEVIGALGVTDVVRTSSSVVTITLPAVANYAIDNDESVTVTIPKLAVVGADADIVATPTIDIVAS